MLNANPLRRPPSGTASTAADGDVSIDVYAILRFLRRHATVIAGFAAGAGMAGLIYSLLATPLYTATARVLVDNSSIKALRDQGPTSDAPTSVTIDSQVEIIRSEPVLLRAVRQLNLASEPEFQKPQSFLTKLRNTVAQFVAPDEISAPEPFDDELLVDWLRGDLNVRRVGFTNVIEIRFTSPNPQRAAKVANAVADAYLADLLEAKYEMGRRAGLWLEDRLKQLSQQTSESDRAVQRFKSENNIVSTERGLINEQQIGEISSQIILARAQVAEAKARWDRVEEILRNDPGDATVTETLRNDIIVRLRQQYLDVSRREAELSARYGQKHMAAVALREEKRQLLDSIKDELRRIAQSYKSDYEIAKLRETTLQNSLNELVTQSRSTNQAQVQLRDLESAVQTSREVQENFLKKYMEIAQQESFPVTEARVISPAKTPRYKSWPLTKRITAAGAVLGLFLGLLIALGREALDNTFRTPAQAEAVLGCRSLGILPDIGHVQLPYRGIAAPPPQRAGPYGQRLLEKDLGALRYAADNPMSQFSETLRRVAFETAGFAGGFGEANAVAFCSAKAGEGKSFVAANFAQLAAVSGKRCLLVDCDLRHPALTHRLSPNADAGIADIVQKRAEIDAAIWNDPVTGLFFLPAISQRGGRQPHDILSPDRVQALMDALRKRFDIIVLDLPPIIPFADVRALAQLVDSFVFVVAWGDTSRDTARAALHSAPDICDKLVGFVLNKADTDKLGHYHRHEEGEYYARYRAGHGFGQDRQA